MHLSRFDFALWAATLAGHIALLCALVWRERTARHPIFTALIAMNIGRTLALYCVYKFGTERQYSYTYWSLAIADVALQFGVVYEIAIRIFRPLGAWAQDLRTYLVTLIGLSLLVAGALTWLASPPAREMLDTVVIKGKFLSSVCMIELMIGMLVISTLAGLPWKTHTARISTGLGVYSIICVLIDTADGYFGFRDDNYYFALLSHIRVIIYLCCQCYWVITLWLDEPPPRFLTDGMRLQLLELRHRVQYDVGKLRSRGLQ